MNGNLKLYRVNLCGFGGYNSGLDYKSSYVVALNSDDAYQMVRKDLDRRDFGFTHDRELESVELLAEDYDYANTKSRLFLPLAVNQS